MVFVRAQIGLPNYGDSEIMFTVQYFDEQGNMIIRGGGSRAWRCNNPGNIHASKYSTSAKRHSIGIVKEGEDEDAVYPDYATGHEALVVMLRGSVYFPKTLREAMIHYDRKNPNYINIIVSKTGFDPERRVKSLNDQEFEKFWQAIEETEKWKKGKEEFIPRSIITGVRKHRGVIYEYRIQQNGQDVWLSKQEAIALVQERKLRAVVVHARNGNVYLRPEYHEKPFGEMVC